MFTSIWIGKKTYVLERDFVEHKEIDVGWFIAESCLALGMVGTVTGFLYMLGTAFENIDIEEARTLQNALSSMAKGMSTALYTTLTGLIASLIIKVQLVNYEVGESE
jgi:flagellar motor component MotA